MGETVGAAADLAARIAAGDAEAEAELVDRYGPPLGYLLRRWTRDPAAAEDLYQETFRVALQKIRGGELRQPDRLAAFLRSLAKNLCIHSFRRRNLREVSDDGDRAALLPDPMRGPLGELLARERAALARKVLLDLPGPRDREILARYYLAEEDKERICTDLGLAAGHFKRVLFRARQRYRDLYESHVEAAAGAGAGGEP